MQKIVFFLCVEKLYQHGKFKECHLKVKFLQVMSLQAFSNFFSGSGSCPECGIPLRRVNFRLQLFEDSFVDKEIEIRRRVLKDFNKTEEDFATLREFGDYQEMVEDIIYNLVLRMTQFDDRK